MSGIFNLESPVVRSVTRVGDLAVLSLMWFVGCIPVVTIGASSTAMYSAIHKVFTQKEGIAAAEFLKCFKSNFRQATLSFPPWERWSFCCWQSALSRISFRSREPPGSISGRCFWCSVTLRHCGW